MVTKGTIEVVCGPMFSGKTEELIKRVRRTTYAKQTHMLFKPQIDDRYSATHVQSHDGNNFPAVIIPDPAHMDVAIQNYRAANGGSLPDVIGVEEVQFLDEEVVQQIYDLKCEGARVIVAGLDMDWRGVPFPIVTTLMGLADKIDKQTAICMKCGDDATYSYLKNKSGEQIQVGAADKYEARCFTHWID